MYDFVKQGECQDVIIDNVCGSIDFEFIIDLCGYDYFMVMFNLGVFKDVGFLFMCMVDLLELVVVLFDNVMFDDFLVYLMLLGCFGSVIGYLVIGVVVIQVVQVDKVVLCDLLVLVLGQNQLLFK